MKFTTVTLLEFLPQGDIYGQRPKIVRNGIVVCDTGTQLEVQLGQQSMPANVVVNYDYARQCARPFISKGRAYHGTIDWKGGSCADLFRNPDMCMIREEATPDHNNHLVRISTENELGVQYRFNSFTAGCVPIIFGAGRDRKHQWADGLIILEEFSAVQIEQKGKPILAVTVCDGSVEVVPWNEYELFYLPLLQERQAQVTQTQKAMVAEDAKTSTGTGTTNVRQNDRPIAGPTKKLAPSNRSHGRRHVSGHAGGHWSNRKNDRRDYDGFPVRSGAKAMK